VQKQSPINLFLSVTGKLTNERFRAREILKPLLCFDQLVGARLFAPVHGSRLVLVMGIQ
jgi:hypothetical protein